jgi:predicted DNA-binding transcriptional regulator AlpA
MTHHLMGVTEIAELLGLSRQRCDQLSRMKGFPDPVAELSSGRVWNTDDVERWAQEAGRQRSEGMIWEHNYPKVWELFEGPDDLKRPRFPLAIVDKKGPYLGQDKKPWYEVRGEAGEYTALPEAKAAAEAMALANEEV